MSSTYSIGIDLGTTQSAAAYVDAHGATQIIRNAEGELLTPSVVLFDRDDVVTGRAAKYARASAANSVADMVKRDMGQSHFHRAVGGKMLPPEVIQGYILRKLRSDIVAATGEDYQAVITVPAYFDEPRRKATADAGHMSGLKVLDIVNEPTAAALAFGERLGYLDPTGAPHDALTLLVYDLGGGTFDVTVIRLTPGNVTTLATDGDAQLGGYDWDMRLADHVRREFRARFPDSPELDQASRLQLRRTVEAAKHALTEQQKTRIQFEYAGNTIDLSVTRDEFEAMTDELVERTAFTTRQAIKAADVLWDDVDRLLLVGGSTRMPMIRKMLYNLSGMILDQNVNPDEAVARGAAIYAQHLLTLRGIHGVSSGLKVTDVNAHSLGIEAVNPYTLRRENIVLIPRNTPLPSETHKIFHTREADQRTVKVQLLEGESTLPGQCTALAKVAIRELPSGLPEGTEVDVCYRFAANGRLSVLAQLAGHGREAKIELERVRGLADDHVAKWKQIICRDGGFEDFDDIATELLRSCDDETEPKVDDQKETQSSRVIKEQSLEPAVPYGAPLAASNVLKRERGTRVQILNPFNNKRLELIIVVLGFTVSAALGLSVGYYVLCLLRPDRFSFSTEWLGL